MNRMRTVLGLKNVWEENGYIYCEFCDESKGQLRFDNVYIKWMKEIYSLICHIGVERDRRFASGDMVKIDSKYAFFGTAESVADQLFYFLLKDVLSECNENRELDTLCYLVIFLNESEWPLEEKVLPELRYIQLLKFMKRLVKEDFNALIQGQYYDFFVSFWSCFEACVNSICEPYEEKIREQLNDSQMKEMKRFLKKVFGSYLSGEEIDEKLDEEKVKFNKTFGRYVSFPDKYTYLMKVVLEDHYIRDAKEDRAFLEFCGALRNTLHNNGMHLKSDREIKISNEVFRLEKGKRFFLDDYAKITVLAKELFDVYVAIVDGVEKINA